MPRDGLTGLVIPVPAADPVLSAVERRLPGTVRPGVPAHVSLLYPFLPTTDLADGSVVTGLTGLFAAQPPIATRFGRCVRDEGFVYLPPEPAAELEALIGTVRQHFPQVTPYEGRYSDVGAHITVAMGASEQSAEVVANVVADKLAIEAELSEAWLVAFHGRWTVRNRFVFQGAQLG